MFFTMTPEQEATFNRVCERARQASHDDSCTQHVNMRVHLRGNEIHAEFLVSDWYDSDCTVRSYDDGRLKD